MGGMNERCGVGGKERRMEEEGIGAIEVSSLPTWRRNQQVRPGTKEPHLLASVTPAASAVNESIRQ